MDLNLTSKAWWIGLGIAILNAVLAAVLGYIGVQASPDLKVIGDQVAATPVTFGLPVWLLLWGPATSALHLLAEWFLKRQS